jgi:hypothetical protein
MHSSCDPLVDAEVLFNRRDPFEGVIDLFAISHDVVGFFLQLGARPRPVPATPAIENNAPGSTFGNNCFSLIGDIFTLKPQLHKSRH